MMTRCHRDHSMSVGLCPHRKHHHPGVFCLCHKAPGLHHGAQLGCNHSLPNQRPMNCALSKTSCHSLHQSHTQQAAQRDPSHNCTRMDGTVCPPGQGLCKRILPQSGRRRVQAISRTSATYCATHRRALTSSAPVAGPLRCAQRTKAMQQF